MATDGDAELIAGVIATELRRRLAACLSAPNGAARARAAQDVVAALHPTPPAQWAAAATELLRVGARDAAVTVLRAASQRWPATEASGVLAQVLAANGDLAGAQATLDEALQHAPGDAAFALQLARLLRNQGRVSAAADILKQHVGPSWNDATLLDAVQLLKQAQREEIAYTLVLDRLRRRHDDARLHASAGNLAMALGRFEQARAHFLGALERGIDLNAWYVGQALTHCQRYRDPHHTDLIVLERLLAAPGLDERGRAALLFGRAKLREDVGDLAPAAQDYRLANAILRRTQPWPRQAWDAQVRARLARRAPTDALSASDFRPVFVVGLPRTGTTLVAERLARHTGVRVRGEPPLLGYIAAQLDALGARADRRALQQAAELYVAQLRQDDAPATWYLDKNPLNFLHLDTVARLFPQARVIVCRRAPRDAALSMWTQFFREDTYAFANDFDDIRRVHDDAEALLQAWGERLPLPMLEVDYEALVDDTDATDAAVARFLDLDPHGATAQGSTAIGSASLWQARQPVYRHALGRGQRFLEHLPELRAAFPDDA